MKAIVWGTGSAADAFNVISEYGEIEIVAYIDNNASLYHTQKDGRDIISPDGIATHMYDIIVICSAYYDEILKQMNELPLKSNAPVYVYTATYSGERSLTDTFNIPFELRSWGVLQHPVLNKCNLLCAHCFRDAHSAISEYVLNFDVYFDILSRFNPRQFNELCISKDGEITLLKNYETFYARLDAMGWRNLQFVTNGTSLDERLFSFLFERNIVSKLIVSIEAVTAEKFEFFRGFSYERFLNFIAMIRKLRAKYDSKTEFLFSACCMKENLAQMPGIVEFAADNEFSHIGFVPLVAGGETADTRKLHIPQQRLSVVDKAEKDAIYRRTVAVADRRGVQVCLPEKICGEYSFGNDKWMPNSSALRCSIPYTFISVSPKGMVTPCCKMHETHGLGGVLDGSFKEVWEGAKFEQLFQCLRSSDSVYPGCVGCTVLQGYAW